MTGPPAESWWAQVRRAGRDVAGVCPGMYLLGISFGLLVVRAGIAWWWAPLFSGLVYAGSLEFLLIALVGVGTSVGAIALTTLLVNGRHLFYGLSFPLHRVKGRLRRTYSMFALVDEAYALTSTREPESLTSTHILAMQVIMQLSWVGGGLTGALAGEGLSLDLSALSFVFTALFVVLAVEAVREGRRFTIPLIAAACAVVARVVAPGEFLLVAMGGFVAALLLLRRSGPATADA